MIHSPLAGVEICSGTLMLQKCRENSGAVVQVRARMIVLNHPASLSLARHPNRWASSASWRTAAKQALNELYSKKRLNKSQAIAITSSITRSFSIWQGPPGTGKTNTLVGLIQVCFMHGQPRRSVGADTLKMDRTIQSCSMFWRMSAHVWCAVSPSFCSRCARIVVSDIRKIV